MTILIAGYGFVGKAVFNAIQTGNTIQIIDPKYTTAEISGYPNAEGIIICVGTPSTDSGNCDDSQIRAVMAQVPVHIPVLIKSTVRPDQLEAIIQEYPEHSICYSPEFLRAATANEDFLNQKYMVIGGEDPEAFWQTLFQKSLPNCKLFFNCTHAEASMIKYATNCWLSTKVSFFNQIYDLCQTNGTNYDLIRQVLTHDNRIGNSHMQVPGPDGSRGFGGACFPKDTSAFVQYAQDLNKALTVLESAVDYNKTVRQIP
jgi:UDPglucose 6-dehydrogenase